MFTGIIEELGRVREVSRQANLTVFKIQAERIPAQTACGESISVNGVCLTAVEIKQGQLVFEVMPETLRVTNLGSLKTGDRVNLERSLKIGDRLSGHFVTGHVDCIGIIRKKKYLEGNLCFEISLPAKFSRYALARGAIAVDGISLTVVDRRADTFRVYIIPHTLKNTTLGFKGPSGKVNIECDILVKGASLHEPA